jgi:hypothetical protein
VFRKSISIGYQIEKRYSGSSKLFTDSKVSSSRGRVAAFMGIKTSGRQGHGSLENMQKKVDFRHASPVDK